MPSRPRLAAVVAPAATVTTVAVVAAAISFAPRAARAQDCEIDRDVVRCAAEGVEMTRPNGWELTPHVAYPGVLVYALHRGAGGRLTLAMQEVPPASPASATIDDSPRQPAERTRRTLAQVGFKVGRITSHPTGALVFESVTPDGARMVRQAFLARSGRVYILTLAAPRDVMPSYVRAFDDALRSLSFRTPERK